MVPRLNLFASKRSKSGWGKRFLWFIICSSSVLVFTASAPSVSAMLQSGATTVFIPLVAAGDAVQPPDPDIDVYYVSPNGNDRSSGQTEPQAWATFDRAWHTLQPGDTLIVLDGVYYQSLRPNKRNGRPGNPITIRAKNDGKVVIDGEYKRVPVQLGDTWGGDSGENPVGNYFVIEGIVARNGDNIPDADGRLDCNGSVWCILNSHHNTLRRISGYDASTDGNSAVITVTEANNNLIEDAVAAGTGRKMVYTYKGEYNTFRRVFAAWGGWDGRLFCQQEWPNGANLQIYNGDYNIIENSIGFGGAAKWNVSMFVNGSNSTVVGNKILGTISVFGGLDWQEDLIDFGNRPPPCDKTADLDNWLNYRAGFFAENIDGAQAHSNEFRDILSYGNGGEGLIYGRGNRAFSVDRATSTGNFGYGRTEGPNPNLGPESESKFRSITNSYIEGTAHQGEGARLTHRYVNGVLTNQPLWPWPMEQRIQDELGISVTDTIMPIISNSPVSASAPAISHRSMSPPVAYRLRTANRSAVHLKPANTTVPTVYAPRIFPGDPFEAAVVWAGEVNPTNNYADLRFWYNDRELKVVAHVIDRLLWYDTSPSPADLTQWDAASLFIDTGSGRFRFDAQLSHWQPRANYQAAYLRAGNGWQHSSTNFSAEVGHSSSGFNDGANDRGWNVTFTIPFTSVTAHNAPPPTSQLWRVAVVIHDRDGAASPGPKTPWPDAFVESEPATWGRLQFGPRSHNPPPTINQGAVTIRQGLNGAAVQDAHVGGHTVCGGPFHPAYFNGWGDANYAGYTQVNIQNQWDISDWPCFSKFYVTFPLDKIPAGKTIASATLTLHQFGNAWGAAIEPSWIQVSTVGQEWNEATLTWNNAPPALENISGAWVSPMGQPLVWPGVAHNWDVAAAVTDAYRTGQPLRLVLYSPDGAYHSGRYFSSSDVNDDIATARPTLVVRWGDQLDISGWRRVFLPLSHN